MLYLKEKSKGSGTVKISGLKEEKKPEMIDSMAISDHTHSVSSSNLEEIFSNKSRHALAMENAALKKRIAELEDHEANFDTNGTPQERVKGFINKV